MNSDIEALDSVVAEKLRGLISAARSRGINIIATSTLRTRAEQTALHAQGRRPLREVNSLRLKAGLPPLRQSGNRIVTSARTSIHEYGCAFDIAVMREGRAVWDTSLDINANGLPEYEEVGCMGEAMGLTWGGRFTIRDMCHFEYTGGLTRKQLLAGLRPAHMKKGGAPIIKEEEKVDTSAQDTQKTAKAGLRSTEFYMALLGAVLPVMNTHLGTEIPVSGVMSIAGVVISYILSRTVLKRG